jgi:hypothetical protein
MFKNHPKIHNAINYLCKVREKNTSTRTLSLVITQGEIFQKKKPAKKYIISIQQGTTLRKPLILAVN